MRAHEEVIDTVWFRTCIKGHDLTSTQNNMESEDDRKAREWLERQEIRHPDISPAAFDRAAEYSQLIHEQARPAVLSLLHDLSLPVAATPQLHCGLLSIMLRGETLREVQEANDALQAYVKRTSKVTYGWKRMGFDASSPDAHMSILSDIVHCLVNNCMLNENGPALSHYATAGNGAFDHDEYLEPPPDTLQASRAFGSCNTPLTDTRHEGIIRYVLHLSKCAPHQLLGNSYALNMLTVECIPTRASPSRRSSSRCGFFAYGFVHCRSGWIKECHINVLRVWYQRYS